MGLNLFVVNDEEREVSNNIRFDTDKYAIDREFLHHIYENCIYKDIKRPWGDDTPIPMKIKDYQMARDWIKLAMLIICVFGQILKTMITKLKNLLTG